MAPRKSNSSRRVRLSAAAASTSPLLCCLAFATRFRMADDVGDRQRADERPDGDLPKFGVTDDGQNAQAIMCRECPSKILKAQQSSYVEIERDLPYKNPADGVEKLTRFWCVDNMYNFENVGFTNQVDTVKYLACADCEIGPIGWHDLKTKKSYVAVNRVSYS